ncbi:glycosyltransferase family 2 protein [Candidatus Micrarchaeota archaeon]|nr:glycosyltransferase family 2 protein [Candidatus Micrarchaeota archaeon]
MVKKRKGKAVAKTHRKARKRVVHSCENNEEECFGGNVLFDERFRELNETNKAQLPSGDAYVSEATSKMGAALLQDVTIVVPAYNEAENLTPLCEKLKRMNARVVVVDDGSTDRTGKIAKRFGFKVVRHLVNKGKGAAMKSGVAASETDKIVLMDADNQHDAEEVYALVKALDKADLVVGDRFAKSVKLPVHRSVANNLIRSVLKAKTKVNDPLCGFRAFRKSKLDFEHKGFIADVEMIFNAVEKGLVVAQAPVTVNYDIKEKSSSKTGIVSGAFEYSKLLGRSLAWALKK